MARIKITKLPAYKLAGLTNEDECPEGQKKDQFGNCIPDFNYQPAQQGMGTGKSSAANATDNVPTVKFKITGIADEAPPEDVAEEIKKDEAERQNKENFMNKPTNQMGSASWAQDFNTKFKINTPEYDPNKKYDKKGNVVVPKKPGNFFRGTGSFWEGAAKLSRAKENFDNAIAPIAAGFSLIDNYKTNRDEKINRQTGNLVENSTAVDNSFAKHGHFDINDGVFDPRNMGAKSIVGQTANPIYPQNTYNSRFGGLIRAAGGMEVPSAIPVQDSFITSSSIFVPQLSELIPPVSAAPAPVPTSTPVNQQTDSESSENIADIIAAKESGGNYKALPKKKDGTLASSAVGKYQFLWNQNKDWISKVTGVTSKEQFMNNPEAQELAFDYWDKTVLTPNAQKIKNELGVQVPINNIKYTIHFAGPTGAYKYFKTGEETVDAFGSTTSKYAGLSKNSSNDLTGFASQHGFDVTSTTGGKHNTGSKHYQGKAIDVRTRNKSPQEIANFIAKAEQQGYKVFDERQRPSGQAVWSGPHLHLEKSKLGGQNNNNNMKIRIVGGPNQMAYGGQSTGGGLDVGARKVYGDQPENPYGSLSKTLQPVSRDKANIEAEKGETIYGDMDGDGQMEHMTVGGKRHVDGGTPLSVPKGSFVFSDTRKMKIKDAEILKYFGITPVKGGVTPADIAKKYDINKFKAILQDPNADRLQKDTAKKMIDSYEDKLGYLALIQESMKGFPNGLPAVAEKVMGAVEGTSEMAYGGNVLPLNLYQGDEGSSTVGTTGGVNPSDLLGVKSRFDALTYGPKITIGGSGTTTSSAPAASSNPANGIPSWYKPWLKSNTKAGRTSPTGKPTVFDPKNPNKFYDDYNYWKKTIGRDFTSPEDFQTSIYDYVGKQDPNAINKMWGYWDSTAAGRKDPKDARRGFVDKFFGARTAEVMGWRPEEKPKVPETPKTPPEETQRYICQNGQVSSLAPNATVPPGATVYNSLDEANKGCAGKPAESTTTLKPGDVPIPGTFTETKGKGDEGGVNRIDARNVGAAYGDLGLLEQMHARYPSIQAQLPEAVPVDWRGAAAALQAQSLGESELAGIYQGGQGQAANNSFKSGQQFNQLQNIIRSVDDKNADIYNKTLADRANTMNTVNQYNNENRIKLLRDENEMRSAYLAAVSDKMKNVVAAKNKLEENKIGRYNTNIAEPYFQRDAQDRIVFNPGKAREEYMAAMKNPGSMTGGTDSDALKKYYDLAIAHGFSPADARIKSWELATGKKAPAAPKTQEPT